MLLCLELILLTPRDYYHAYYLVTFLLPEQRAARTCINTYALKFIGRYLNRKHKMMNTMTTALHAIV
jgi:hypothetical protein